MHYINDFGFHLKNIESLLKRTYRGGYDGKVDRF